MKRKTEPNDKEEILKQNIFGNYWIQISTKKGRKDKQQSICYHNWSKSGFQTISDIWQDEESRWLNGEEILAKLKDQRNWRIESIDVII